MAPFRAATFLERGCGIRKIDSGIGYRWFGSFVEETAIGRSPFHPHPQALESSLPPRTASSPHCTQVRCEGVRPKGALGISQGQWLGPKIGQGGRERRSKRRFKFSAKTAQDARQFFIWRFGASTNDCKTVPYAALLEYYLKSNQPSTLYNGIQITT